MNGGGDVVRIFTGTGNNGITVADRNAFDGVDCGPGRDQFAADPGDAVADNCEKRFQDTWSAAHVAATTREIN